VLSIPKWGSFSQEGSSWRKKTRAPQMERRAPEKKDHLLLWAWAVCCALKKGEALLVDAVRQRGGGRHLHKRESSTVQRFESYSSVLDPFIEGRLRLRGGGCSAFGWRLRAANDRYSSEIQGNLPVGKERPTGRWGGGGCGKANHHRIRWLDRLHREELYIPPKKTQRQTTCCYPA